MCWNSLVCAFSELSGLCSQSAVPVLTHYLPPVRPQRERLYATLQECNMRATIVTMELQQDSDPNRLDLHRLLVDDARDQLASFIADRQNYFGRNGEASGRGKEG